jgi:hypothetical protein
MYASGAGIIVYILGSYIIDKYEGIGIYGNLFLFSLIIGILGLFYLIRIPERKQEIKAINPRKFIRRLCLPFKDKNFRPLLYFGLLSGFAINLSAPFFLVFMIDDLSLSFFIISIFLVIHAISRIYGLNLWRHFIDKFGAKPLLIVSTTVTTLIPLGFVFINNKNYFLIALILALSAVSYAAIDISLGKILFQSAPRKYDAYYLSTFTALTGLMSALGPIMGGLLAFLIKNNTQIPFINILSPLKYVFIISFIVRTLSIPLASKIYEPKAKDVNDIIERMKTLKFTSFFVNIYNFADYASKIVLVPQKQFFILQRKTIERAKRDLTNILPVFSKISTSLNKTYKKVTPHGEKRIIELTETLTKKIDKLDYAKGGQLQKISQRVLSKMESLESSMEKDNKREIKQKVRSIQKSIETSKEKLDKTYEKN